MEFTIWQNNLKIIISVRWGDVTLCEVFILPPSNGVGGMLLFVKCLFAPSINLVHRWCIIGYWDIPYLHVFLLSVALTSSVASPICQEGQSERILPIFAFSSHFSSCSRFFLIFPSFPDFSRYLANFSLSRGALCPLAYILATPLLLTFTDITFFLDNRSCDKIYRQCPE